jgi:hypothetical protein
MRAAMSDEPPAANPTRILSGALNALCACVLTEVSAVSNVAAANATQTRLRYLDGRCMPCPAAAPLSADATVILPAPHTSKPAPIQKMSYVRSGIAIVICAGIGAAIAWIVVSSIGLGGVAGAIAAIVIGMVLATALFAGGVVLGKALGYFK